MITPEYCLLMARYNRWQNAELLKSLESMTDADLREDRGAFFGSIFRTVNHLLWGDTLWISRFDGGEGPAQTDDQDGHNRWCENARRMVDGAISH